LKRTALRPIPKIFHRQSGWHAPDLLKVTADHTNSLGGRSGGAMTEELKRPKRLRDSADQLNKSAA